MQVRRALLVVVVLAALFMSACSVPHTAKYFKVAESEVTPAMQYKAARVWAGLVHQLKVHRHADPWAVCTRAHESDRDDINHNGLHDGGYQAFNPDGPYLGAYQFLQSTWNGAAAALGLHHLVGRDPRTVHAYDQDQVAIGYMHRVGKGPWGGRC